MNSISREQAENKPRNGKPPPLRKSRLSLGVSRENAKPAVKFTGVQFRGLMKALYV